MELSSSKIKKISYISGNETFLPHIFLIFQERTFRDRKVKKTRSEKISYISRNGNF